MLGTTGLKSQKGFTIVELMITLSVLSIILVMSTVILIQVGDLINKGVNAANLQNTSRNISANITAALQFSGVAPVTGTSGGLSALCIGNVRYSYVKYSEMGTDSAYNPITHTPANTTTPHVLWRDTIQPGAPCNPLNISISTVDADASSAPPDTSGSPSSGYDMISDHMRLTNFHATSAATGTGDTYTVDVWMAFGDSDLVNTDPATSQSTCTGTATQFCSVSQISSAVTGRVY